MVVFHEMDSSFLYGKASVFLADVRHLQQQRLSGASGREYPAKSRDKTREVSVNSEDADAGKR